LLPNHLLVLAILLEGTTHVENLLESNAIRYMLDALDAMRVPVARNPDDPMVVTVNGQAGHIDTSAEGTVELFLGNDGMTMHPLVAVLCMRRGNFVLYSVFWMREHLIVDLINGLHQLGADVVCLKETSCPLMTIAVHLLTGAARPSLGRCPPISSPPCS
jgi:3-phosphoshikimate 1-carboxyvinyltransferase